MADEQPDYEVELAARGGKFPAFGYLAVAAGSSREALDQALRILEANPGTAVAWRDGADRPVRWADFFVPDLELEVTDLTPFGTKWQLRKYSAGGR